MVWLAVRDALDAVDAGRLSMLPPTYVTCLELQPFRALEEALAAASLRERSTVEPELVIDADGARLELPPGPAALLRARSQPPPAAEGSR